MMRRSLLHVVLALFAVSLLASCSESEDVDPYRTVSLKEACYGTPVSKNFKYKLVNPEIVALHRNLGLIREGNQLEFIAARSLEDKFEGVAGGQFELAVVKKFSPFVHFKVERITTETDTIFPAQAGGMAYPSITSAAEYGIDSFEEQDIDAIPYNRTAFLKQLKNKKIRVTGKLLAEKSEGKTNFFLEGKNAKLRISDTSDGTALILKVLADKNYLFEGGIMMIEEESYSNRMKNRIAGTFEIQYVMYGDRLISG
ncbi:MAG: hypothetical protein OEN01_16220 [Candidatus Krumholzibacteria bacterium]|nr:hypothetical protein [Candidatus Krumholzibacteria bacterium]